MIQSEKDQALTPFHQTKHWYLSQIKVFADLHEKDKKELREISHMVSYRQRELICFPGQPGETLFLLKEGRVKIFQVSEKGQKATICLLEPGEIFGEVETIAGISRETGVQALEPVLVCEIARGNFLRFLERCPTLAIRILAKVGGQLRYVESKYADMVFRSAQGRLAKLLLKLSDTMGEEEAGKTRLNIRLTHQNLANLIGTSRETVSALLSQFQRQGLLLQERRTLYLLDPGRLNQIT